MHKICECCYTHATFQKGKQTSLVNVYHLRGDHVDSLAEREEHQHRLHSHGARRSLDERAQALSNHPRSLRLTDATRNRRPANRHFELAINRLELVSVPSSGDIDRDDEQGYLMK